jgi:AbrB family looped-hinge helix DNA binding protein
MQEVFDMLELSTVSARGQVTIPASMREKYNINIGDKIIFEDSEGCLIIKKPTNFFALEGCFSLGNIPDNEEELLTPEMGRLMEEE